MISLKYYLVNPLISWAYLQSIGNKRLLNSWLIPAQQIIRKPTPIDKYASLELSVPHGGSSAGQSLHSLSVLASNNGGRGEARGMDLLSFRNFLRLVKCCLIPAVWKVCLLPKLRILNT